jgi:protein tyrosine phosphatase
MHCSAGVGRTGTLMALNKIIGEIEGGANEVDMFNTVLRFRSDRVLMVSVMTLQTTLILFY